MEDDARCCGTGHCMINAQGQCWCGQQWDGTKMCFAPQGAPVDALSPAPAPDTPSALSVGAPKTPPTSAA